MPIPSVSHWTCAVPKAGADAADYEDAAAITTDDWPVCAAVADGATESAFARTWARRLVRGLTEQTVTSAEAFGDRVRDWQEEWQAGATERAADQPWYVAAKAAEGAFAAVLGLSLYADGRWRAVAVGDCCLFHVRDGALVQSWPFASRDAFTNRPALVPSRPDRVVPTPDTTGGSWHSNDRFALATDAGAAWLLGEGLDPLRDGSEAAHDRVEAARADGTLRNDDVTFLVMDLASSPEADDAASGSS